jgi:hypothetical protein
MGKAMLHEATQSPQKDLVLSWVSPEDNLWVASVNGEYAGMVEFEDGHFIVRDPTGHDLGSHSSLPDAKALIVGRLQTPTLLSVVHDTLSSLSDSLTASLPKAAPQYHRTAAVGEHRATA